MVDPDQLRLFVFGKRNHCAVSDMFSHASNVIFSIVRAFLIEEQRIVAMVMKSKKSTDTVPAAVAPATSQKSK